MNEITIVGTIGADPELRFGKDNGTPWLPLRVAVNHRGKDAQGNWTDVSTDWFNVKVFNGLAENVAESCPKGTRVIVHGTLELREYEHEGTTKISADITADSVGPDLRFATAQVVKNSKGSTSSPAPATVPDGEPF